MIRGKSTFLFNTLVWFLIFLASVSCSQKKKYVMPEKNFVNLLVDLHLAEAIAGESKKLNTEYKIDSASLYGSVFSKHHINYVIFDSTMLYYSRHPDKFQRIYNEVTAALKHREAEIAEAQKKEDQTVATTIWESDSIYRIVQGSEKLMIDVPIRDTGVYIVSASVKMLPEDVSLDPRMSVYFYRESDTSKSGRLPFKEVRYTVRNGQERVYRSVLRLTDTTYRHLRGYIANYSNGDTLFNRKMVIKDVKVSVRQPKQLP